MNGKRYFDKRNPKGEVAEWKQELIDKHKQKDALKKIIAAMTIGKDVSAVFAEVTSCSQTSDLELKKLVYLYLINYAKTQPELAILAVNTFVKDSNDHNPMLRALAIRTMGCIRVDRITEYLCDPLERALKDQDPYVRKTAAICVAKVYDMSAELARERGFLDMLRDMVNDANPMVASNAVAALSEIYDLAGGEVYTITRATASYLLTALEQCTEWGQVYLLDCLAAQPVADEAETEALLTRVASRLQHANSAVVLAAVKVVLCHLDGVAAPEKRADFLRKLAAPLVTLLSQRPEVQYVALRSINLVLQKHPDVLAAEARVFYCKYNDPIYVKLEKLDIMAALAAEGNISGVLAELKEYAQEVDVDFVRKAVRCIGQVALRLEAAAGACVDALLELVALKVAYVVQEAVVVLRDIFRCYPNRYEAAIAPLCEALDVLEEPDAKAAMVWIVGEYAERIDNADELLNLLLDTFLDEPVAVQLQLLTAAVKLFLKKPAAGDAQKMISSVLTAATQQTDNPDLRDRAYMYWRLLSAMPEDAQKVVLAEKPTIRDRSRSLEPALRDALIRHLSTLAAVYHKLPHDFVTRQRVAVQSLSELEAQRRSAGDDAGAAAQGEAESADFVGVSSGGAAAAEAPRSSEPTAMDLLGGLADTEDTIEPASTIEPTSSSAPQQPVLDLLGGLDDLSVGGGGGSGAAVPRGPPTAEEDPFGLGGLGGGAAAAADHAAAQPPLPHLASAHGCEVHGDVVHDGMQYIFRVALTNRSGGVMSGFHVQFNRNAAGVGVAVGNTALAVAPLNPGQTGHSQKQLDTMPDKRDASLGPVLQTALKWTELTEAPFVMLPVELPTHAGQLP